MLKKLKTAKAIIKIIKKTGHIVTDVAFVGSSIQLEIESKKKKQSPNFKINKRIKIIKSRTKCN